MIYGREALRQYREQEHQSENRQQDVLAQIPADAPMDDATLTVWNGERWVAWDTWLATAPLVVEEKPQEAKPAPAVDTRPRGSQQQIGLW
ncbi:MAG: hypothetical protein IT537_14590 [Hyphomicrobiales bacterium]|nr:hypothetical protein [Hyphomicrobiales bacterium]